MDELFRLDDLVILTEPSLTDVKLKCVMNKLKVGDIKPNRLQVGNFKISAYAEFKVTLDVPDVLDGIAYPRQFVVAFECQVNRTLRQQTFDERIAKVNDQLRAYIGTKEQKEHLKEKREVVFTWLKAVVENHNTTTRAKIAEEMVEGIKDNEALIKPIEAVKKSAKAFDTTFNKLVESATDLVISEHCTTPEEIEEMKKFDFSELLKNKLA